MMDFFSDDYFEARKKFLAVSQEKKGEIISYNHPGDKALFIDAAVFGNIHAKKAYVNISGVHGVEGFAGSSYQISFICNRLDRIDKNDLKLVFVHALNPFGFSYLHRENEDNVDLNRNFLWSWRKKPANPDFDRLYPLLKNFDPRKKNSGEINIIDNLQRNDAKNFESMLYKGQYIYPDGLFYGGDKPSWSYLVLKKLFDSCLSDVEKAAYLDIHTGYGKYLNAELYSFYNENSAKHRLVKNWFGPLLRVIPKPYPINGSLLSWAQRYFRKKKFLGGSIEFGTTSPSALKYLCFDSFIKFNDQDTKASAAENKILLKNALFPKSKNWRKITSNLCLKVMQKGIDFLS